MAYPSKFQKLEEMYGKPIAEILVEKLNQFGNIEDVAHDIDISYRHVVNKVNACGIKKHVRYELPETSHVS